MDTELINIITENALSSIDLSVDNLTSIIEDLNNVYKEYQIVPLHMLIEIEKEAENLISRVNALRRLKR